MKYILLPSNVIPSFLAYICKSVLRQWATAPSFGRGHLTGSLFDNARAYLFSGTVKRRVVTFPCFIFIVYNIYFYLKLCNLFIKKNSTGFSTGCQPSVIVHHNVLTVFIVRHIFETGRINLFDTFSLSSPLLHVPAKRNTRMAFATLSFQTLLRFPILPGLLQLFRRGRGELCCIQLCQG